MYVCITISDILSRNRKAANYDLPENTINSRGFIFKLQRNYFDLIVHIFSLNVNCSQILRAAPSTSMP